MIRVGEFAVYIATRGPHKGRPVIDDGRCGECFQGTASEARDLAKDLLQAADLADTLAHG